MGSKLKRKEKNDIGNHGEHSTRIDTKRVTQMDNEHIFMKECSVNLAPPIIMKRLKKSPRKHPETTEDPIFGLKKEYPKRRKIENYQRNLMKINYIGPFNIQYFTINTINIFHKLKFRSTIYNIKNHKIPSQFSKMNPVIVLDFIKHPSVDKISYLLDLMYNESIIFKKHAIDIIRSEKSRKMSIDLKKYLLGLCYQKFCELWLLKKSRITLSSPKNFKKFIRALLRHAICRTTMCNRNLKKLLLYNGGLTGYPKKPHLVLCINIISSFFTTISRKCFRMICMGYRKMLYLKSYKRQVSSLQLYHTGTTKRKSFLEIIDEYKRLMQIDRLSAYQVADIKHAYERILEPGQCIDKADLEICANENYDFNRFQADGTKINSTVISEDLNTINNDDFDFDDIDTTSDSLETEFYCSSTPETLSDFQDGKFLKHKVEFFKELQHRFNFIPKDDRNNMGTTEDNSKNRSIEAIEKEVHIQYTSNEDHNIENETLRCSTREVKPFIDCLEQKRTTIVDKDMDISNCNLEGTTSATYSLEGTSTYLERATNTLQLQSISSNNCSTISGRFEKQLIMHPIKLNKLEKRTLSIILYSDINIYKINWKRYPPCSRRRLFQIIVHFGSFKMALCDKLKLNCLGLREKNKCDMIDIDRLLKSIEVEACLSREYFTFTEVDNFLIFSLGKYIVNNIISQKSPTISILFSFVKNVITKYCEKAKDFLEKSGLRIVLNKETLFESLSNVPIGQDVHNTVSLKYAHAYAQPSHSANNDLPESSKSEHFCMKNTEFCIKKYSSNEEIRKSTIDILESDDSFHQFWKECNNSRRFISRLLEAGVTLPIEENNSGHDSKFIEVCVRWFCKEYLQNDKFYKSAVSIFKNIFLYIDTASGCTDIKVEAAINNALMILYDQPCFAKEYESYLNTKYSKCLSSSKHNSTDDTENHSVFKSVNIRGIEELQIEPNVNVQMDPIDTNDVGMSLVTSNISTCYDLVGSDYITINNLVTSDTQSSNDDFFDELMKENHEIESNNSFLDIDNFGQNNALISSVTGDLGLMDTEVPNYNDHIFNEDDPFDDPSLNNTYHELVFIEKSLIKPVSETNSIFQPSKNNVEEESMLSNDLISFDNEDQINVSELKAKNEVECGFDHAGTLTYED